MRTLRLLLLLTLTTGVAKAEEILKLTAQPIPFFIESEERGTFIDLTKEIATKLGVKVSVEVYPNVRAIDIFRKGRSLAFLPGSHPKLDKHDYFETEPIFYKKIFIYSKSPESFSSLKDLAHKRIGVTMGYTYPPDLAKVTGVEIQEAANDEGNLRKLHAGRIDAFLGEEVSVNDGIESLGFKEIGYKKEKFLTKEPIFYAFQKSPEGERWFQKFNETIRLMKKAGTLDKIVLKK
ncbi:MAG: transporter substrate-binding domain-containing protein [Bdellovibrionales bacterium]|nr:transporter substrate-binding domain-containing protein [Bdellovibrionales bacterium]